MNNLSGLEYGSGDQFLCGKTGRKCDQKIAVLRETERISAVIRSAGLDGYAERERNRAEQDKRVIKAQFEEVGLDVDSAKIVRHLVDDAEIRIAELSIALSPRTISCDGLRSFGRCGAFLVTE